MNNNAAPKMDPAEDASQILFFSIVGGLCPLIPVPCLDSVFVKVVRRLMAAAQLRHSGLQATMSQVNTLAREASITRKECAMKVAWFGLCCCVVEFVLKKLCFFLTIKDCVDNASELLHEGWLIAYAAKAGFLTQQSLADKAEMWRVSEAIVKTCDEADTSVMKQALRQIFGNNKQDMNTSANTVNGALRLQGVGNGCLGSNASDDNVQEALDSVEREQRTELRGITGKLAEALRTQRPYFSKLEQAFVAKLGKLRDTGAQGPECSLLPC
mmetsp:Transcript_124395/g.387275  ORF Transcript_124395/g.387275 Transcript_124395/m.387275 type:complete len:270 (-) Transcript_124395:118-927(-)